MNTITIKDISAGEVSIYVGLNEKQLRHYYEPNGGIFICESGKVIRRAIEAGYSVESFFVEEGRLAEISDLADDTVPVYAASKSVMRDVTGYSLTGGLLASMTRKPSINPDDIIKRAQKVVILDDVENPTNVGAIFRSAAALNADAVLLTEGSADPLYRRASRVSMGAVFSIDWAYITSDYVAKMCENGFEVVALSLTDDAISLSDYSGKCNKQALVLGNEDHGISEAILSQCDCSVIIPMAHGVDSLNVAAASAVAFWEMFNS